jgi:hypothetical protein
LVASNITKSLEITDNQNSELQNYINMLNLLNSFYQWIKRSFSVSNDKEFCCLAWKSYLEIIIPNTITLMIFLDEIFLQKDNLLLSCTAVGRDEMVKLFDITTNEKMLLLQLELNEENKKILQYERLTLFSRVWNLIAKTRDSFYQQLGLYATLGIFYKVDIMGVCKLFNGLSNLQLFHWKAFISTLATPIILNCPDYQVLSEILMKLTGALNSFLNIQWQNKIKSINEQ